MSRIFPTECEPVLTWCSSARARESANRHIFDDGVACEDYDYGTGGDSAAGDQYDDGGEITVGPQGSDNRTPKTGGPKFEVFPLQADGDCPRPLVKRGGACYP